MMADDTFVRDWLLEGEADPDRMIRYLGEIRNQYGLFTSFLVSEKTRRYYHFSGISQIVSEDDPKDAWYFRVRKMDEDHEINVDLNEEQQNALTVFINRKVYGYDGGYIATTGVGIAFDALATVVERYKENFSRHVYFVDKSGKIMVRSDDASIREDNIHEAEGASGIADELLASDQSFFEYDRDGETMLVSARHIPELNWWVIIEQEEARALVGIRQSLVTNFFVGIASIVLTLVTVLYAVNLFYARLEQKAVEMAELAEHEATLNRQLKYESEVKDRFFSMISHDLISPFSALLAGTELMSKHAHLYDKEELVELAGKVNERGQGVFNLLRNLLEWSRLQIDGANFAPTELTLDSVTQESIDILAPVADEKNIRIVNDVTGETAYADPNMVDTVLRNLITNAIKFSHADSEIKISAAKNAGMTQVTVSDTGVGIAKDRIDGIFDLERLSSTAGTKGEEGTGLGLSLCREMVELNGGKFWFDTEEGKGSQFHFTLPATRGDG
jgi:signal transduction histidine kinase